jgi:hypothetical protein
MPNRVKDETGRRYGKLVVQHRDESAEADEAVWYCKCDCGNFRSMRGTHLRKQHEPSCGCDRSEKAGRRATRHGKADSRVYQTWRSMLKRCYQTRNASYSRYGGRGIEVCERWRHSFENFLADMGEGGEGMSLERIDSDDHYGPDNCRWATAKEQANNRRDNRRVTFRDQTKTVTAWAEEMGLRPGLVVARIAAGWSVDDALQTPPRKKLPNGCGRRTVAAGDHARLRDQ